MLKKSVAVLEIGSQRVTCVIAQRGVNGTFIFKSVSECDYDGFDGGKFFSKSSVMQAISSVIDETSKSARTRITDLYVGVPGEFSALRTKAHTVAYKYKRKISDKDIRGMYGAFYLGNGSDYFITDVSATSFELDDGRRILHPEGIRTYRLTGHLSYFLCHKEFSFIVDSACRAVGVKNIHYVSESLAEAQYLFAEDQRDYPRLLIDCGYLTTNVIVAYGGGILRQKAFSYGGGYITANLIDEFELDYDFAELLKRKVNLGLSLSSGDKYNVGLNDEYRSFPVDKVNYSVCGCLDELSGRVMQLISDWNIVPDRNLPVALTGGGICYMRGAKEHLSSRIGTGVYVCVPPVPSMNLPEKAANLALLDRVLKKVEGEVF